MLISQSCPVSSDHRWHCCCHSSAHSTSPPVPLQAGMGTVELLPQPQTQSQAWQLGQQYQQREALLTWHEGTEGILGDSAFPCSFPLHADSSTAFSSGWQMLYTTAEEWHKHLNCLGPPLFIKQKGYLGSQWDGEPYLSLYHSRCQDEMWQHAVEYQLPW